VPRKKSFLRREENERYSCLQIPTGSQSELIEETHCVDQAAVCNCESACPLPEMFKADGTRRADEMV
jgi:hypothetical protein